ncbi:hypothetical protein SERLA73DRAFT_176045 [Serpula lacrymans var. lacrymans S7.3]|uniref:Uncharacterized protein n=2 Tax=Serpula lacrymans var. lacrymans TaxID=341189 RepID=F8PM71_SERL3|nr:uncharacterized protein SERLADRAFT_458771 [Serpula lacrymans var. lacrymans S7.9]EGO02703.1 hypothetical protein SERLA73DRAFT_176045 [Serpula lacrymans var. lacrymans S7.3]EGO28406.1 hypothetical protein SERLADRAFT_458771 [Serpula lacrymans var. lacrymans S7.9]
MSVMKTKAYIWFSIWATFNVELIRGSSVADDDLWCTIGIMGICGCLYAYMPW